MIQEDYADFIIESMMTEEMLKKKYPKAIVNPFVHRYAFLHYPLKDFPDKNYIERFGYSAVPKLFGLMDTSNIEETGVLKLQNQPTLSLRGQGCLVGIIDTGIDYQNDLFKNADGTTRIERIWDQTLEGSSPKGFDFGSEYDREMINSALESNTPNEVVPSRDENGHGTFLAGIAAGNYSLENDFSGIATDSRLVVVKLRQAKRYLRDFYRIREGVEAYQENHIMQGVEYILSVAGELGRPVSICIGLGTNQGGHDGRMPFEDYISYLAEVGGVSISVAAGNEGNAQNHYEGIVEDGNQTEVEVKVEKEVLGFTMELWGAIPSEFRIGIVSPSGQIYEPSVGFGNTRQKLSFVLEGTEIVTYHRVFEMQAGDYVVFFQFTNPAEGIWKIQVHPRTSLDKRYDIWLPIQNFTDKKVTFLLSNPFETLTSTATAEGPAVIASYQHTNQTVDVNSSRGYTRKERIKPDVAAPGVNIYGPGLNGTFTIKSGTSVAAAHATGIAALLLEWGIVRGNFSYMDGIDIKKLMIFGAKRNVGAPFPNREWGDDGYKVYGNLFLKIMKGNLKSKSFGVVKT